MKKITFQMLLWLAVVFSVSVISAQNPGWRMRQSIYSNMPYLPGSTTRHTIYTYHDSHPELVDSVLIGDYVYATNWVYSDFFLFEYDPEYRHIIRNETFDYNIPTNTTGLITAEYDNQNRLIQLNEYWPEGDSISHNAYISKYFIYGDAAISEAYLFINLGSENDNYFHTIYETDAQGRIISSANYRSPDSLNWYATGRQNITYHASDTSTGQQYINNLARTLDFSLYNYYPYVLQKGKFTQLLNQEFVSNMWVNTYNYVCEYDENNQPVTNFSQSWGSGHWDNVSRDTYYYDVNGNLDYYDIYSFQQGQWTAQYHNVAFDWDQYTANEDEVLPAITLKLTSYPNPFKQNVNITLQSKSNALVNMAVYNIKGQMIKSFASTNKSIVWDGKDKDNKPVSKGIYFIRVVQDGKSVSRKIIRIK